MFMLSVCLVTYCMLVPDWVQDWVEDWAED